jgi:hypothetical protein
VRDEILELDLGVLLETDVESSQNQTALSNPTLFFDFRRGLLVALLPFLKKRLRLVPGEPGSCACESSAGGRIGGKPFAPPSTLL